MRFIMKRQALGILSLVLGVVTSSYAALKEGDIAPDFKTQASLAGKEFTFSLHDALKKGPVVVYFYPAAFTGGCNLQAHTFAENHDKFAAAGASVIGVSLDSIARLNDFSSDPKYCAGKLPVASDEKGEIAKSYDIKITDSYKGQPIASMKDSRGIEIGHATAERTTFVVTPDNKIVKTIGGLGGDANAEQALAVVQQLAANRTARN
jgi:thioredoxin-dependent peroxiredoxin